MGASASKPGDAASAAPSTTGWMPAMDGERHIPDAALSSNISSPEEAAQKKKAYANIRSVYVEERKKKRGGGSAAAAAGSLSCNLIEEVYNEDFTSIDHAQAMRFPPMVAQQLKSAVRDEAERRCTETEKTMARCLQDKMWTSWKCQKERDVYYHCVEDIEKRNMRPDPEDPSFVDLMTSNRWKYNMGVFYGEIIGRNNIMKQIWRSHYPDRDLPHPWVKDA